MSREEEGGDGGLQIRDTVGLERGLARPLSSTYMPTAACRLACASTHVNGTTTRNPELKSVKDVMRVEQAAQPRAPGRPEVTWSDQNGSVSLPTHAPSPNAPPEPQCG